MDDNRQNGNRDILLDRRQLDQVMKTINKQASHKHYDYSDSSSLQVEIDELFSYVEINALLSRLSAARKNENPETKGIDRHSWIEQLLDKLESHYEQRIQATELLLAMALGDFDKRNGDTKDQMDAIVKNNILLYDVGVFHTIQQSLKHACNQLFQVSTDPVDTEEKLLVEIDLYLTLSYLILETNRQQGRFENDKDALEANFLNYLFVILARLKDNFMHSFPVKKLLLLIWKVILVTLGNIDKTKSLKDEYRKKCGLSPIKKSQIVKCSQQDLITFQNDLLSRYPTYTPPSNAIPALNNVSPLTAKATPALATAMGITNATSQTTLPYQVLFPPKQSKGGNDNKQLGGGNAQLNGSTTNDDPWNSTQAMVLPLSESGPSIPTNLKEASTIYQEHLQLSTKDYQIIMERQRAIQKWQKLEQNGYSQQLTDKFGALCMDESTAETKDSTGDYRDIFSKVEHFYASTVPELQGIVIVLLKQLLTTATVKAKPTNKSGANTDGQRKQQQEQEQQSQQQQQQQQQTMDSADVDRNREILCKSISAILLLMLKWLKTSHALKFEYFSQLLVDSGCMLLILKIFGLQEIGTQAGIKTDVDNYSLLQQMLAFQPKTTNGTNGSVYSSPPASPSATLSSNNESQYTNERNLFWIISLLRVLQMLSKGKVHRIMLLVQYKSSAIFKRVYKISHPMVELYALKNLKNQVPRLGRKWRSVNMKMISAIYFCCPPDLRDDWLITRTDKDGDLEEGKTEEINLRILVRLYHGRRYLPKLLPEDDRKIIDYTDENTGHSTGHTLNKVHDLDTTSLLYENDVDDTFKMNYEAWLEKEVYSNQWKYDSSETDKHTTVDNGDDYDDDEDDGVKRKQLIDWSLGTPIPASPTRRLSTSGHSGVSPTLLAQEINKLYHEELNREFNMNFETQDANILTATGGWDTPIEPTNIMGERLYEKGSMLECDDDDGDSGENWLSDPLQDIDWSTLSEEELAKRLAIVEEKTVQRWMDVDIDDSRYIKVLNTFENVENDPMNEVWDAVDPSLQTWS